MSEAREGEAPRLSPEDREAVAYEMTGMFIHEVKTHRDFGNAWNGIALEDRAEIAEKIQHELHALVPRLEKLMLPKVEGWVDEQAPVYFDMDISKKKVAPG